ncbi:MAG: HalOD1 output domain-containing protein [Haloarculaceae archaeon]
MNQVQTPIAGTDDICESVVEAMAEAEGVDPTELTPTLYEVIDPDALEQLFASPMPAGWMEGRVTFFYNGYEVTVCGDGYVVVEERGE